MTAPPARGAGQARPARRSGGRSTIPAHGFLHPVDLDARAARARRASSSCSHASGPTVHVLDAETDDDPDLVYTFDPLLVTDRGAIPLRPGQAEPRAASPRSSRRGRSAAGIPTLGRIEAPGTIEGGDTFWLRPDLLCIGRTLRTNDAGRAPARRDRRRRRPRVRRPVLAAARPSSSTCCRSSRRSPTTSRSSSCRCCRSGCGRCSATSASGSSRCPTRSTRRSAATCWPSGRAS